MRSLFLSLFLAALSVAAQPTNILIDAGMHHLGEKEVKGFPEMNRKPEGPRLDVAFQAESNSSEYTLRLVQRDVIDDWGIELNQQRIARLDIDNSEHVAHFSVPPGTIVEGENKLSIVPRDPRDEILVGKIELIPQKLKDFLKLGHLVVTIADPSGSKVLPARITVVDATNRLARLYNVTPAAAGWRRGIVYNAASPVEFDLPEGDWIVYATRGTEWSRAQAGVRVFLGQRNHLNLRLARQVDTTRYIAADTHLHTLTFSGHGDASLDERIITLAGEGVEMAIATDHNHFTDYKPRQAALHSTEYFTSVVGNEVTSGNGHFNAFPFSLDAAKPNHKETNWVKLVADIRDKGAQFVILNHPRWPAITNSPFSIWGVNRITGSRTNHMDFTMDALEINNSSFPLKDPDFLLRDWFALLNRGEKLWGVGASDSHTIGDPPGQGRTYIPSVTDDPAAIDVDAVVKQMQAGNMSISYGIFGYAAANGTKMGQTTKPVDGNIEVEFHVGCANWIPARRAAVYLNGIKVAQKELAMRPNAHLNTNVTFKIPAPANDAFLICVAYGEGIKDRSWRTLGGYTAAITNPIFIDADGDGKYRSARETALAKLENLEPLSVEKLESAVTDLDPAIGVHMMAEARTRLPAEKLGEWDRLLEKLALKHDFYLFYRTPSADR